LLAASGCVQHAVLENDVRSAQWKARTLATSSNLRQAETALSVQLVELEALYQRAPDDARVRALLSRGYGTLARGFIEARRLEALATGDSASVERERRDQADAAARAAFYGKSLGPDAGGRPLVDRALAEAEAACSNHDRAAYERQLNELLARTASDSEQRLQHALAQRLAALWLEPRVAERCAF
jgi:hypothetical protein